MTLTLIDPNATEKIFANRHRLRAGSWGGQETVCMMSALVSGAKGRTDCVTAGWPEWLADLNVYLFDADVGVDDEDAARFDYALKIAELVQTPRDYDKARDLFLIRRLDTGDHSALKTLASVPGDWSQQRHAIQSVVSLLQRRINGEDVAKELAAARAAAEAAAGAATRAAGAATRAATRATGAATRAAIWAAAAAAEAAAGATGAAGWAAGAAAWASARDDLIIALGAS